VELATEAPLTGAPPVAAWKHVGARDGFEVLFVRAGRDTTVLEGHAVAVEQGDAWSVRYVVSVDASWATRSARVTCRSALGSFDVRLEADAAGRWQIDGEPAPELDGSLDVDLEASASTNALPVRRLGLSVGESADAPATYLRATDLHVERLDQRYTRLPDDDGRIRFDYEAPALAYRGVLIYDQLGLVLDYPGIAVRVV
jgi:uncharacterized protein